MGCGKQGEMMVLSPKYVRDKVYAENRYGRRDKTVVHEWGHLRWGVFDEYPTPFNPKFFVSSRDLIEATRCSEAINGKYVENGAPCQADPKTGIYRRSCDFTDESIRQTSQTSLMYKQFLDSVNFFCSSNAADESKRHYEEAPNNQNKHCSRQGTWDVILNTDDFKDGNNPPIVGDVNTNPTFQIVQYSSTRRIVLILDTSGSMAGDPIAKLRQGMDQYISSIVPTGSYVGIVTFSNTAVRKANLALLDDQSSREDLILKLPSRTGGSTSIGSGVLEGIQVLSFDQDPAGGFLLVVSDGNNNFNPDIDDVVDEVVNAGVIVDTIAFTDNADTSLRILSDVSGGNTYFYRADTDSITVLNEVLIATITDRSDLENQDPPISLFSEALSASSSANTTGEVTIDKSVGVDTIFSFTWLDFPIEVTLNGPNGITFDQSSEEYDLNNNDNIITIRLTTTAVSGNWKFFITLLSSSSQFQSQIVSVNVQSKQVSEDDPPVTINSFVSDPFIDYQQDPYIVVFAFATKGNDPVANADVIAILEKSDGSDDVIELYDSGTSADITKDDGVYSGYFFNFTGDGRYNVEVKVRGNQNTAAISNGGNSRSYPIQGLEEEAVMIPVDMFERSASGGAIQVTNHVDSDIDFFGPSQIIDLAVIGVSYERQSATLQWTAVGDDFDKGKVFEYDIRFAETFQGISRNFSDADRVTFDDVTNGDLSVIGKPGDIEEITVRLPSRGDEVSYFFGIQAIDDANNTGGLSNIVAANLQYIPPLNPDETDTAIVLYVVVGVVGAMGVVMMLIIIMYLKRRRRNANNPNAMDI
ncbi:calcium-activated chloride channel regulator 1-like [Antedon mediterranea]|uniref:calcium-activated chloride channel regulator 1-like n=1 Tax=Antedon mediterranea TaxID=105859 RepID=UPI003AF461FF